MLTKGSGGLAPDGKEINIFTLSLNDISIQVMDWGATWLSYKVKVDNNYKEILLGCSPPDYNKQAAYMGATVGRYANRIANSRFKLNNKTYVLTANQDQHQLHGGPIGFDKVRWHLEKCGQNFVQFSHFSEDEDQGFPGNLKVFVTYCLLENNTVSVEYNAESDQDTPLNLTNHAYFNLDNAEKGTDIRDHKLQVSANYFLPVNNQGIPNSSLKSVQNTSFDFNQAKTIRDDFLKEEQIVTKGYDHAFLLKPTDEFHAKLTSSDNKISLCVKTSQPSVQIYTGNYLEGTINRLGDVYHDYSGIALETQALPDTPNHPEWHKFGGIIKAKEKYHQWTTYRVFII